MNKKIVYFVLSVLAMGLFVSCDDEQVYVGTVMTDMAFNSPVVTKQPVIEGTDVKFHIAFNTTDQELSELVPVVGLSQGARVDPPSGSKVDFSNGPVVFTVIAGNNIQKRSYIVSWVRDPNPDAMITGMTFSDPIVVGQPVIEGTEISFYMDFYATDADIKELVPTIEVSPQATVTPASGRKVDFSNGPVKFTVNAGDGKGKTEYTVTCKRAPSPEASISEITMAGEAVITQPVINGLDISFIVDGTNPDLLKEIVPTIKISDNATIDPASGAKVDFSGGTVVFTVTAQDGETQVQYNVTAKQAAVEKYDMEQWTEESGTFGKVPTPSGGWSTSNIGVQWLMNMTVSGVPLADRLNVSNSDDSNSGTSAVKMETLFTKGHDMIIAKIPKVTSGTLFLGSFKTNMTNTLKSSQFGVVYNKKPLRVNGYYKYTPGPIFYEATGMSDCHLAKENPEKTDECDINAILYEIENDSDPYITGDKTYEDSRIIARATLSDGMAKADYTQFSLTFVYSKPYDPTKKYRFAIICSSSKWGNTFSGSPGSVLFVDDIVILSE